MTKTENLHSFGKIVEALFDACIRLFTKGRMKKKREEHYALPTRWNCLLLQEEKSVRKPDEILKNKFKQLQL